MLARYLRIMLLLEAAAYVAIAHWLAFLYGWTYPWLAAGAVTFALATRLLIVLISEALAAINASPRPPELRIGAFAASAMVLREWRAATAVNLFRFPFERWSLRPDPAPIPGTRIPVLLAHGFFSNRGYFGPLVRSLEARGLGPFFAPNFSGTFATIERYAAELHIEIERIVAGTGRDRVVLVCHSMGGLAARQYLAEHGTGRLARLVTIGSPHHGTVLAPLGLGVNARQMHCGSGFLAALEAREGAGPAVAATSIYSAHDNLVAPQETSRLAWARNIALAGRGHIEMLHSAATAELVAAELREAGAA